MPAQKIIRRLFGCIFGWMIPKKLRFGQARQLWTQAIETYRSEGRLNAELLETRILYSAAPAPNAAPPAEETSSSAEATPAPVPDAASTAEPGSTSAAQAEPLASGETNIPADQEVELVNELVDPNVRRLPEIDAAEDSSAGSEEEPHFLGGTGAGAFTDSGQSLGQYNSKSVSLGDVDGDGDLDAFVANSTTQINKLWLNDGSGFFSDSGLRLGNSNSGGVSLGDVDGDGDLDAFVANRGYQGNKVWLNDGNGTFTDSSQSMGRSDSRSVSLGDIDGDGDLDAFVANSGSGQRNTVWLNDGSGAFTDSRQSLGASKSLSVSLGDVDGDGDLDAFVTNFAYGGNEVWLNDGSGSFFDSSQNPGSMYSRSVGLGDLDGDGDLDAFVANNGANKVWRNDSEETGVRLIDGDLVISDDLGGDTDDDLTISADGTNLTIVDNNGNGIDLGSITGTGHGTDTVVISLSEWTGGLFVNSVGGDDKITIGGLTGILGSISVDGGTGFDRVILTGNNTLATNANAEITSERIVGKAINLATRGTGTITLSATGSGPGAFHGIDLEDSNLSSRSGAIALTGEGGSGNNHNDGVRLDNTDLSTVDANITIDGTGAGTGSKNRGVYLLGGSTIAAAGSGNLIITGAGGSSGTSRNAGVFFHSKSQLSTVDGDLTVIGRGDGTRSTNYGVYAVRSSFTSNAAAATGGNITINGNGSNTAVRSSNAGVYLNTGVQVSAQGNSGNIDIDGTAGANGRSRGYGVIIKNCPGVTTNGGDITINGTGNGSKNFNSGVRIQNAAVTVSDDSDSLGITIEGTGSGSASGSGNRGVYLIRSSVTTSGSLLTINGTGGSGTNHNTGVHIVGIRTPNTATLSSLDGTTITGAALAATSGSKNMGVYLRSGTYTAFEYSITGTGGGGINSNYGVYARSAQVSSFAQSTAIIGLANASATGRSNSGVYLQRTIAESPTGLTITGIGGGGTNKNIGVYTSGRGRLLSDGTNSITGDALATTSGSRNFGVYLRGGEAAGRTQYITGIGGGGTSSNQGLRIDRGSAIATGGSAIFMGQALATTVTKDNVGAVINSAIIGGTVDATVTGIGGGGPAGTNHGISMNAIKPFGGAINTNGTAGAGPNSLDRAGDFFS